MMPRRLRTSADALVSPRPYACTSANAKLHSRRCTQPPTLSTPALKAGCKFLRAVKQPSQRTCSCFYAGNAQKANPEAYSNDALRKALAQVVEDRDRLAHDNRILKSGVVSLNAKREQLARQLDETSNALQEVTMRYHDLERAIAMHNMQVGACRRDESANFFGGQGDGDVF